MLIGDKLRSALRSFAAVEDEIIAFGRNADATQGLYFIQKRKEMVEQFGALRDALEADPYLIENPAVKTEGLRLFSAFRTKNATSRADWPVIRIRENLTEFREVAKSVGPFSRAFWKWVEEELDHRR